MLIDKKGRLLGKVSIVDAVIVLIILVIASTGLRRIKESLSNQQKKGIPL